MPLQFLRNGVKEWKREGGGNWYSECSSGYSCTLNPHFLPMKAQPHIWIKFCTLPITLGGSRDWKRPSRLLSCFQAFLWKTKVWFGGDVLSRKSHVNREVPIQSGEMNRWGFVNKNNELRRIRNKCIWKAPRGFYRWKDIIFPSKCDLCCKMGNLLSNCWEQSSSTH